MLTCPDSPVVTEGEEGRLAAGRCSGSQRISAMTVVGLAESLRRIAAAQRAWWLPERSMAVTSGQCRGAVSGGVLQGSADDLAVLFWQVAAARLPDPDDRQAPLPRRFP
jgi:hypothetical protein